MKAVHTARKRASVGFSLLGIMSLRALLHLSLASPLRRSRTFINLLAACVEVLKLCKLIKLSAPEESNFEGYILENWELLSDGVIGSSNGIGVLGLESEVLGEIRLRKAEVHGEG
jgi:hypothetical protein